MNVYIYIYIDIVAEESNRTESNNVIQYDILTRADIFVH